MLPRRTRERPARRYLKTLAKNIRMKYTANGPANPMRQPSECTPATISRNSSSENPSNRKYLSIERIEKAPNQTYELTPKEARKNGPIERTPKKPDRDYLSDEDKLIYDELINKIKEAKEAEKEAKRPKPLTEREKLIKRIEKMQKMLDEMPD